jgi:hypothetical protein
MTVWRRQTPRHGAILKDGRGIFRGAINAANGVNKMQMAGKPGNNKGYFGFPG